MRSSKVLAAALIFLGWGASFSGRAIAQFSDIQPATLTNAGALTESDCAVTQFSDVQPAVLTSEGELTRSIQTTSVQPAVLVGEGSLSDDDELKTNDGSPIDYFIFDGEVSERIVITAESSDFDIMVGLFLITEDDLIPVAANNDVDGTTTNARIEATLSTTGKYAIFVAAADSAGRGNYVVTLEGTGDS